MKRFYLVFIALFIFSVARAQPLDTLIKKAFFQNWNNVIANGYRPFYVYKILGVEHDADTTTYYLVIAMGAYKIDGVYLKEDGKSIIPAKIVKTRDKVVGYEPLEGQDYSQSIREIFPEKYHKQIFNIYKYFNADSAMYLTRQKALNYWHFVRLYLFYPQSWTEYENTINQYVNGDITNPWGKIRLLRRPVYFYPTDSLKYYVALEQYRIHPPFGNKELAQISYFKQKTDTIFILLNADVDGWAGVSYFLAQVHPLVEKALLQFNDVKKVVWGYAPEDK